MKQRVKLFIFSVLILTFLGCNPVEKVTVLKAEMPTLGGFSSLKGELTIRNDNSQAVVAEEAVITVYYKGKLFLGAHLTAPVKVPARKTSVVTYELGLDNVTLTTITTLPRAINSPAEITVDIDAVVRYGGSGKKVKVKGMSLMDIITTFDAS